MRTRFKWLAFFIIEVFGAAAVWVFFIARWWRPDPHGSSVHLLCGLLLFAAMLVAYFALIFTPIYVLTSSLFVKKAIKSAQENDYEKVRRHLSPPIPYVFLPLPKYAEIISILEHLSEDRKSKPDKMSSEFSQYIVTDDMGNYIINLEGTEKMMKIANSGWLNAKQAENIGSPKVFKIAMRLVVIVAIIRGVALIIQILTHH